MARNSFWSRTQNVLSHIFTSRHNMLSQCSTTYCTSIWNINAKQMILLCSSEHSMRTSNYWKGNIHFKWRAILSLFVRLTGSEQMLCALMEWQLQGLLFVSLFLDTLLSNILIMENCAKTTIMALNTALLLRISLSTSYLPSFTIFLRATYNLDNLFYRGKTRQLSTNVGTSK